MTTNLEYLTGEELCASLRNNPDIKYAPGVVTKVLSKWQPCYAKIFYFLSASHQTIVAVTYKNTPLYKDFRQFTEEDILYICEGIKLQLARGMDDFYLVSHYFFNRLFVSAQLRRFLIYVMTSCDFRMREFLASHDIINHVYQYAQNDGADMTFVVKFIKCAIEMESTVVDKLLLDRKCTLKLSERGYSAFFRRWLVVSGTRHKDNISIS